MKKISIITLCLSVLFFSCRKNNDDKVVSLANRVKTLTETGTNISGTQLTSYFYDNEGRQIKTIRHDGTVAEIFYKTGKVIFKQTNTQGQASQSTGYLNEAGLLIYSQSGTGAVNYSYNADGYLLHAVLISYNNNQANPFQISDNFYSSASGVLDSTVTTVSGSKSTRHYTQYTSHLNNAFERFGTTFNPPSQKYLFKELKSRGSNNVVSTTTAAYEHDAKGRLVKEVFTTGAHYKNKCV
jgi:hypothetical protein